MARSDIYEPEQLLGRRRGRIARACSQCYARKQKCDGATPCRNCIVRQLPNLCQPRGVHPRPPPQHGQTRAPRQTRAAQALQPAQSPPRTPESLGPGQPVEDTAHSPEEPDGTTATKGSCTVSAVAAPAGTGTSVGISEETVSEDAAAGSAAANSAATPIATTAAAASQAASVGQLWKSRGAPSFFGSSYFGPQVAAALLDTPAPYIQPGATPSLRSSMARPFRDESGPFSQLWDLLGMLPRQRSTVDRLVERFLDDVSPASDAVHLPSFRQAYERFYSRKAGADDVTTVDIRWLALLFIVLAMGAYLDCPRDAPPAVQREYEEASMGFFWASRRAIVIAPSFYGESMDLVRAGILVTRYCLFSQRIAESWLTIGFAARIAMAQGLHIDGTHWGLPRRVTEARRRLWCHIYILDRMIALALGRPYGILDNLSVTRPPENVFLDDEEGGSGLTPDASADAPASPAPPLDITTHPTPSVLAIFSLPLACVIGRIQERTFGLEAASYREVMGLDAQLLAWRQSLPPYLRMDHAGGADLGHGSGAATTAFDAAYPFLPWHRRYLHTAFYFARITLHRPYMLRISVTDQHRYSREVCFASACADLKTRLEHDTHGASPAEHYTWALSAPQLFNSAIVLGLLALQEQTPSPSSSPGASAARHDLHAVVHDLQAYCEKERNEVWVNDFRLAEVRVVELCIDRLRRRMRSTRPAAAGHATAAGTEVHGVPDTESSAPSGVPPPGPVPPPLFSPLSLFASTTQPTHLPPPLTQQRAMPPPAAPSSWLNAAATVLDDGGLSHRVPTGWGHTGANGGGGGGGSAGWFDDSTMLLRPPGDSFTETFSFPGPTDLDTWQDVIDAIDRQADGQLFPGVA